MNFNNLWEEATEEEKKKSAFKKLGALRSWRPSYATVADFSGRMLEGRRDVVLFAVPSQLDAMGRSRHDGEPISFRSRSQEKRESIRSYGRTWTRSFRSSRSLQIGTVDVEENLDRGKCSKSIWNFR